MFKNLLFTGIIFLSVSSLSMDENNDSNDESTEEIDKKKYVDKKRKLARTESVYYLTDLLLSEETTKKLKIHEKKQN